jgi:hypothetical protein
MSSILDTDLSSCRRYTAASHTAVIDRAIVDVKELANEGFLINITIVDKAMAVTTKSTTKTIRKYESSALTAVDATAVLREFDYSLSGSITVSAADP